MIDLRGICLYYSYIGYRADPWRLTLGKQVSFYVGHALWICLFAHMSFCIFEKIQPALTIRSHQKFEYSAAYRAAQYIVTADFLISLTQIIITLLFQSVRVRQVKKIRNLYACISEFQALVFPVIYFMSGQIYCGPFNLNFILALLNQLAITVAWGIRLCCGIFGASVHGNSIWIQKQNNIILLEITRVICLSVQVIGFYTQHFYVNILTGLALLVTQYFSYSVHHSCERQTEIHKIYYWVYSVQIYFGIICVVCKFVYVSFESIIVYLLSTVALMSVYMYSSERRQQLQTSTRCIQQDVSSPNEIASWIRESVSHINPDILAQDFLTYLRSSQRNNLLSAQKKLLLYCELLCKSEYHEVIQASQEERLECVIVLTSLYINKFPSRTAEQQLQRYIVECLRSSDLYQTASPGAQQEVLTLDKKRLHLQLQALIYDCTGLRFEGVAETRRFVPDDAIFYEQIDGGVLEQQLGGEHIYTFPLVQTREINMFLEKILKLADQYLEARDEVAKSVQLDREFSVQFSCLDSSWKIGCQIEKYLSQFAKKYKLSVAYQQTAAYVHQNLYLNRESTELNSFVEYCRPISYSSEKEYTQITLFGKQLLAVQRSNRYLAARPTIQSPQLYLSTESLLSEKFKKIWADKNYKSLIFPSVIIAAICALLCYVLTISGILVTDDNRPINTFVRTMRALASDDSAQICLTATTLSEEYFKIGPHASFLPSQGGIIRYDYVLPQIHSLAGTCNSSAPPSIDRLKYSLSKITNLLTIAFANVESCIGDVRTEQFRQTIYNILICGCMIIVFAYIVHIYLYFDILAFRNTTYSNEKEVVKRVATPGTSFHASQVTGLLVKSKKPDRHQVRQNNIVKSKIIFLVATIVIMPLAISGFVTPFPNKGAQTMTKYNSIRQLIKLETEYFEYENDFIAIGNVERLLYNSISDSNTIDLIDKSGMLDYYNAQLCNIAMLSNHSEVCDNETIVRKLITDAEIRDMSLFYVKPSLSFAPKILDQLSVQTSYSREVSWRYIVLFIMPAIGSLLAILHQKVKKQSQVFEIVSCTLLSIIPLTVLITQAIPQYSDSLFAVEEIDDLMKLVSVDPGFSLYRDTTSYSDKELCLAFAVYQKKYGRQNINLFENFEGKNLISACENYSVGSVVLELENMKRRTLKVLKNDTETYHVYYVVGIVLKLLEIVSIVCVSIFYQQMPRAGYHQKNESRSVGRSLDRTKRLKLLVDVCLIVCTVPPLICATICLLADGLFEYQTAADMQQICDSGHVDDLLSWDSVQFRSQELRELVSHFKENECADTAGILLKKSRAIKQLARLIHGLLVFSLALLPVLIYLFLRINKAQQRVQKYCQYVDTLIEGFQESFDKCDQEKS